MLYNLAILCETAWLPKKVRKRFGLAKVFVSHENHVFVVLSIEDAWVIPLVRLVRDEKINYQIRFKICQAFSQTIL